MLNAPSVHWVEFRFNAGRLALDLSATVRRRASAPHDLLAAPGGAARWLEEAGLVRHALRLAPARAKALLRLREAIWLTASALIEHRPWPAHAARLINRAAAHPVAVPRLDASSFDGSGLEKGRARCTFSTPDTLKAALSSIARDAIELLTSADAHRIKACAQPDCRMLFLDGSPAGRRRWCSMNRCGSRAKGRTFRLERAARAQAGAAHRPARGASTSGASGGRVRSGQERK